jgi:histidinol-phosphate aminotransferase
VLGEDRAWVRDRVREVRENRDRLLGELRRRGVMTFDSSANFVLLCVADAAGCGAALRARGVAVRAFGGLTGIGDCLRVSIGPWHAIDRFLRAFDEVGWT